MPDPTNTALESQLRDLGSSAEPGDPATEWRPGEERAAAEPAAALSPDVFRDAKGYSMQDYESAAAELEAGGQADLAAKARANAAAVEQAEAAARHLAFEREWQQHAEEERAGTPELQDDNSELSRAVQDFLREVPALHQSPRGFQHAAAVARARVQAVELPALRARLETLTKENERLARLTSIPGSPPARSGRDAAEPGLGERELRRLAYDFDSAGAL